MKTNPEAPLTKWTIVELFPEHHLFDKTRDLHKLIARRAYRLFADSGFENGHDLDDWLNAERELLHSAPVEICETGSELIVRAELPGFRESEITVAIEPRSIIIVAEREADSKEKKAKILYSEWRSSTVFRSISLPTPVNSHKVSGHLNNGVLEVRLPKAVSGKDRPLAA